jgi:hypothetical protein
MRRGDTYATMTPSLSLYCAAAAAVVLLLVIFAASATLRGGAAGGPPAAGLLEAMASPSMEKGGGARQARRRKGRSAFGTPQRYEYGDFLVAAAAAGGAPHGLRELDHDRGYDHGAGGVSRIDFDQGHGYYAYDGLGSR